MRSIHGWYSYIYWGIELDVRLGVGDLYGKSRFYFNFFKFRWYGPWRDLK